MKQLVQKRAKRKQSTSSSTATGVCALPAPETATPALAYTATPENAIIHVLENSLVQHRLWRRKEADDNYTVVSYFSLCHVTCNVKLDEVKVTEEHALFLFT